MVRLGIKPRALAAHSSGSGNPAQAERLSEYQKGFSTSVGKQLCPYAHEFSLKSGIT